MGADNRLRRRKQLPDPSSTLGASKIHRHTGPKFTAYTSEMLCAWPVGHNEWRIQSRLGAASKYMRSSLKLTRCAWAVCGGHLVIFKVLGTKADAQRVMRNVTRSVRENFTERASGDFDLRGVFID